MCSIKECFHFITCHCFETRIKPLASSATSVDQTIATTAVPIIQNTPAPPPVPVFAYPPTPLHTAGSGGTDITVVSSPIQGRGANYAAAGPSCPGYPSPRVNPTGDTHSPSGVPTHLFPGSNIASTTASSRNLFSPTASTILSPSGSTRGKSGSDTSRPNNSSQNHSPAAAAAVPTAFPPVQMLSQAAAPAVARTQVSNSAVFYRQSRVNNPVSLAALVQSVPEGVVPPTLTTTHRRFSHPTTDPKAVLKSVPVLVHSESSVSAVNETSQVQVTLPGHLKNSMMSPGTSPGGTPPSANHNLNNGVQN